VAVVLFAAGLSAQGKPDFTGKWTLQPDPNAAAAGGGGGGGGRGGGRGGGGGGVFNCGMECTIAQDATSITITPTTQQGPGTPRKIMLTGDTKIEMPGRQGAAGTTETAKASWEGNKLILTMTRSIDRGGSPMTINSKQTIAMEGGNLTVESSTDMGQGAQAGPKQTYKKG
jgi:hypothetical protein